MGEMVQIYTRTASTFLGSPNGMITPVSTTIDGSLAYVAGASARKVMTATRPTSNPAAGSVVIGSGVSYMKILPFLQTASGTASSGGAWAMAVWGWNYNPEHNIWVPHLINAFQTNAVIANDCGTAFTHPKFGLVRYFGSTNGTIQVLSAAYGIDGKRLGKMGMVVDAFGSELLEVEFAQTGAVDTFNFHYSTL